MLALAVDLWLFLILAFAAGFLFGRLPSRSLKAHRPSASVADMPR